MATLENTLADVANTLTTPPIPSQRDRAYVIEVLRLDGSRKAHGFARGAFFLLDILEAAVCVPGCRICHCESPARREFLSTRRRILSPLVTATSRDVKAAIKMLDEAEQRRATT